MIIEMTSTKPNGTSPAPASQRRSAVSESSAGLRFTLILAWTFVALVLAWGTYESVQMLTGTIPRF